MKLEQLDLDSVEAVVDEKVEEKVIIISSPKLLCSTYFGPLLFLF